MVKFTVRFTEEEKKLLDLKSKTLGISKNELIKYLVNKKLIEVEEEFEVLRELKESYKQYGFQLQKIGVVLNQINKNFYQNKSEEIEKIELEIDKEIDKLWQFINLLKESEKVE